MRTRDVVLAVALLFHFPCAQASSLRGTLGLEMSPPVAMRRLATTPTGAPTMAPTKFDCSLLEDKTERKNCENNDDPTENLLMLLGIILGLIVLAFISKKCAARRMIRTHDENGEEIKKVPKPPKPKTVKSIIAAKQSPAQARMEKKYGPPPDESKMGPPPGMMQPPTLQLGQGLRPLGSLNEESQRAPPAQKTIPFDVNKPFGWKRRQGNSLLLTKVTEGKQAHELGVKIGWQIVSVDGVGVKTAEDFDNEIEDAKKSEHGSKEVEITFNMLPFRLPSLADGPDVSEKLGDKNGEEDEDSGRLRMFESPEKPKDKKDPDDTAEKKPSILKKESLSEKLEKKDKADAEKAAKESKSAADDKKEAKEKQEEGAAVVEMTDVKDASYRPADKEALEEEAK